MKKLIIALCLANFIGTIPVEAARSGRPAIIITTTRTGSGSVSPN